MPAAPRRTRRRDPLASPAAIRRLLDELGATLPDLLPPDHKQLVAMLIAVRNLYVRPAVATNRGRPGRHPRAHLLQVDAVLRSLLRRETSIAVRSFVSHYLPVLNSPPDVVEALEGEHINLFEAH